MYKNSVPLQSGDLLDAMQYRLLITEKMLNPTSDVKIFRYCNESPKFTEYKMKLKKLLNDIELECKNAPNNTFGFLEKLRNKWVKI